MVRSNLYNGPINMDGFECKVDMHTISIKNKNGTKNIGIPKYMDIQLIDNEIHINSNKDTLNKAERSMYGTTIREIMSALKVLQDGATETIWIKGPGYTAKQKGDHIFLYIGNSHEVSIVIPIGIHLNITDTKSIGMTHLGSVQIVASSYDKQILGNFVAEIIRKKRYNPCTGNGIVSKKDLPLKRKTREGKK